MVELERLNISMTGIELLDYNLDMTTELLTDNITVLSIGYIDSPLGVIQITTDNSAIRSIIFLDSNEIPTPNDSPSIVLSSIQNELNLYFAGKLKKFNTPVYLNGTAFQNLAWQGLLHIPYGETISYSEEAYKIGNPKAVRAVAKANAANPISIVVPCHRVINHNGQLGGYAGGLERKQWLLDHEKRHR